MEKVVREELDDEDYQIKEVFAVYGRAAYQAQVLERGLANVLTVARTAAARGSGDDFDAFLEQHLGSTMGRLVSLLGPHVHEDGDVLPNLRAALEERNRLAHRFFRQHELDFGSFSGREEMLAELYGLIELFESVDASLRIVIDRLLASVGMTAEQRRNLEAAEVLRLQQLAESRDRSEA
ncbi:hypothetical protein [Nocardioides pocheonensis]|nr:hypothetical protein [Nocardioides pocheonensis]